MTGAALLIATIAVVGVGLSTWAAEQLRFEERVAIGLVVGPLAVSLVGLLMFLVGGMGPGTVALAVGVPGVPAVAGLVNDRRRLAFEAGWAWDRLWLPWADTRSLRPLALLTAAGAVVSTRVLALAYQRTPTGLSAGTLANWADGAAHAAYAGSFAHGDNRSLDLPIAAGHGFAYHFLADFWAALFTPVGATVPQALSASAWMLAIAWPVLVWCLVERLGVGRLAAGLTTLAFTLSGGFGWWYFLHDLADGGWDTLTTLPRTYARIPDEQLWLDNTIQVSLYAQRSTQLGLSVGLVAAILVLSARPSGRRAGFAAAGVAVGVLGIAHAHTLGTAVALGALAWFADRHSGRAAPWPWFLAPALLLGLPLTWAIAPDQNSIRWLVGWMAPAAGQNWLWFWIRNLGPVLPLFAVVSAAGLAGRRWVPRRIHRLTAPLWPWFVVPNLVAFHPWEANNEKFFVFWRFAAAVALGTLAARWWHGAARTGRARRVVRAAVVVTAVASATAAGALDLVRATQRSTAIPWVTDDDLAVAAWLREHTDPDAVLVYAMTNTSAAFSLGGRRAVSGYDGWTYDLGIADWYQRVLDSASILAGAPGTEQLVDRYGVDYVVIGPSERDLRGASDSYWATAGEVAFCAATTCVYAVRDPATGAEP